MEALFIKEQYFWIACRNLLHTAPWGAVPTLRLNRSSTIHIVDVGDGGEHRRFISPVWVMAAWGRLTRSLRDALFGDSYRMLRRFISSKSATAAGPSAPLRGATQRPPRSKSVAQLALHSLREFNRGDTRGKGFVEHGPQSLADAGGVDDDVLRYPQFGKSLDFAENGDVILTRPLLEVNGAVGGGLHLQPIRILRRLTSSKWAVVA